MERGFLEECLAKGMSLQAIGDLVAKHPSTVGYWLAKYGLAASNSKRHTPKGCVERDVLKAFLDEGRTLREIADRLDRSVATVRHWISRYDLRTVRRERSGEAGHPVKVERLCQRHGRVQFVLEGRGYYRCARCRAEAVGRRRRIVKRKLVEEAGGCCAICGYSRCLRALQFHHLDPATKEFHLGHRGHARALSRSRVEAEKCALLCANCHAEVEAGLTAMPLDSNMKADPV